MLKRKIYGSLHEWKLRKHKCLVIRGQGQVGKTFVAKEFGKGNYDHIVYMDLSTETEIKTILNEDLDIRSILNNLAFYRDANEFVPGSTIMIIDGIHLCNRAHDLLKDLHTDGRYDVIAIGPLFWSTNENTEHEEHITMDSMDFEEFLWAMGFPQDMIDGIKKCIRDRNQIDKTVMKIVSSHFRDFLTVGGMPGAVWSFVNENFTSASAILKHIIEDRWKDINMNNRGIKIIKTLECFDSIPSQLSENNKRFTYSRISTKNGSRSSAEKYLESLLWLKNAGFVSFCKALKEISTPLQKNTDDELFRAYVTDTGVLTHMMGDNAIWAAHNGNMSYNMGAVAENAIVECLIKSGYEPYYYRKSNGDNKMEIDLVLEIDEDIVAIEVDSGKKRAYPSLKKVNDVFKTDRKISFGNNNISIDDDGIEHYPFFASAFFKESMYKGI